MKKVPRRVVERTQTEQPTHNHPTHPFLQTETNQQDYPLSTQNHHQFKNQQAQLQTHSQQPPTHFHHAGDEESKSAKEQGTNAKKNVADQISISPNSYPKSQTNNVQVPANATKSEGKTGEEQRRSKIEQLKQKYLKKNINEVKTEVIQTPIVKQEAILQYSAPAIVTKTEHQQVKVAQTITKEQPKVTILEPQKIEQQQREVVTVKTFKPPQVIPKPKVNPVVKLRQQQNNTSSIPITKESIIQQEQPSIIKQNTKTFCPPPPRIKNAPRHPPIIVPKRVQPQQTLIESQSIIEQKISQHFPQSQQKEVQYKPKHEQSIASNYSEDIPVLGIEQSIKYWLDSPSSLLSQAIPIINKLNAEQNFTFASNNPQFNSSLSDFLTQFVLKNRNSLSEGQKIALYNFGVQYFYQNELISTELLFILLKLGTSYLLKYQAQIKTQFYLTCEAIVFNKHFFTNEELSSAVNLLAEKELNEKELLYLLLIYPSERILTLLSSRNFNNVNHILAFLSFIHTKKDFSLFIMTYLKLINLLIDNMPEHINLIERILKHLNQLQTNDKSYQLHKQIKLKLINLLSKSQPPQVKPSKTEAKEQKSEGLVGYWTKAVDKIKTATTQLVDLKEPPKSAPKQQQQQEDIVYDPVLKRYLINGKVPDDQNERPKENTSSKAPPPPKQNNKAVPPPLLGKKGKVATNRYA